MKKYVALEEKTLSIGGRSFKIIPGEEYNENAFTEAFGRFFKQIGTYTSPAPLTTPQLITEQAPTPAPVELLIDDSSDVNIVITEDAVEEVTEQAPAEEVTEQAPVEEVTEQAPTRRRK
jgi:hypothetical protein